GAPGKLITSISEPTMKDHERDQVKRVRPAGLVEHVGGYRSRARECGGRGSSATRGGDRRTHRGTPGRGDWCSDRDVGTPGKAITDGLGTCRELSELPASASHPVSEQHMTNYLRVREDCRRALWRRCARQLMHLCRASAATASTFQGCGHPDPDHC